MPRNGYWIECIPVSGERKTIEDNNVEPLYRAIISSIPEAKVTGESPDEAINKLRAKLKALNRYYRMTGKSWPERDNPVSPPRNLSSVRGWISVYVQIAENCNKSGLC